MDNLDRLRRGASELGVHLTEAMGEVMLAYLELLGKWNQAYNLTAVRDPERQLPWHLLDSLSVAPCLLAGRSADVGSGAGLPGIPLAIALPQQPFVLIDSRAKRVRFLRQAVTKLRLDNVEIWHGRVEDYRPPECFANVVARAFAALPVLTRVSGHLLCAGGQIVAMKGRYPQSEIDTLDSLWQLADTPRLDVPGLDAERHLIVLKKI